MGWAFLATSATADTPATMYIFPAGGQRGTDVTFRVGGLYLHDSCPFEMVGHGVQASPRIDRTKTIWFEGPIVRNFSASRQAEDYPQDMDGSVTIASDAAVGPRAWRVWTAQGAVPARPFIIGALPELVEEEIDGGPVPVKVALPLTVNGRIFPREDVDVWIFDARAGAEIVCSVLTSKLGSPFDARLEIRDPEGARLAESTEVAPAGSDAFVRFIAPVDGLYSVRIHDVKFGGLQPYVYRLTISSGPWVEHVYPLGGRRGTLGRFELSGANLPANPFEAALPADGPSRFATTFGPPESLSHSLTLDLDDVPEVLEQEPNDSPDQTHPLQVPAVLNGRIGRPGDVDCWKVLAAKDQTIVFDLLAARLGSPLDSVLVLEDAAGKELARTDDVYQTDSSMTFTFREAGAYLLRVEERVMSRGGSAFAYRLKATGAPAPDFRLHWPADVVSVNRGGEAKLKLRIERLGSFAAPIRLEFAGLPEGVSVANATVPANAGDFDVTFRADAAAPVVGQAVVVRGIATIDEKQVERVATFSSSPASFPELDSLLVAVCVPTPFVVKGEYEGPHAARGTKFVKRFKLERNGFEGPLRVRMADRQAMHLQGVTGPTIEVPAGVSEFDYTISLAPWLETGRRSLSVIMAVGEVVDPDGSRHTVSFTSLDVNEQLRPMIEEAELSLLVGPRSLLEAPGEQVALGVRVGRGQGLKVPVRVELVVPAHIAGVAAEPITLPADQAAGTLAIRFADQCGPFNMPLAVRATALKGGIHDVVSETNVEIVSRKRTRGGGAPPRTVLGR